MAEALCRCVLRLKGYGILASRQRSKLGEIDLIAARGRVLAFVEVKARPSVREASEAIMPQQRARIVRAAADFLTRNPRYNGYTLRFDAMLVRPWRWPKHIMSAWEAEA